MDPVPFFLNFTHLHELSSLSFILLLWCIDLVDPQHRQSAVRHAFHCRVDKNSNIRQYNYYDSKLLASLVCFAELFLTGLLGI